MKPTRLEFTIKYGVDANPDSNEWGSKTSDWVEYVKDQFLFSSAANKTFEVLELREIPPDESTVFFVLNSYQNGEEGVHAITADGYQLRDGWYYLPHGWCDPPVKRPCASREAAEQALNKWKILESLRREEEAY
jgi:hypothetical protein